MPVHVRFFASLRRAAGDDGVDIEARTVGDAVRQLKRRFRGNAEFLRFLGISNAILNGQNVVFLRGGKTSLADGDELVFFPPLGGG